MAKGASIKFQSYNETVPKLLDIVKLSGELKKHKTIILKPSLKDDSTPSTKAEFTEAVLAYCMKHKNAESQVFIAEGSDGIDTMDLFDSKGYRSLAEKYSIGLIDLNNADVESVKDGEFLKFEEIKYPKILLDSFIISLPTLAEDSETEVQTSLGNMIGAFPSKYYSGFFSSRKSKMRKFPIKYAIHDVLKVKMPQFAVFDASDKGVIFAGVPLEMDKQAAKMLGKEWKSVYHIRLLDESFNKPVKSDKLVV